MEVFMQQDRRIGKFYVPRASYWTGDILPVLKKLDFIPCRVEFLHHRDAFEYIGTSPLFENISFGGEPPEYRIIAHTLEDDSITVEVEKVK